jgi:hypothetical protein
MAQNQNEAVDTTFKDREVHLRKLESQVSALERNARKRLTQASRPKWRNPLFLTAHASDNSKSGPAHKRLALQFLPTAGYCGCADWFALSASF